MATFKFTSGTTTIDSDGELIDMAELAVEIDPLTRKTTVGGISMSIIDDGAIREAIEANPFFGAQVEILVGDELDTEAAFVKVFEGVVLEAVPEEGLVKIEVENGLNMVRDRDLRANDFAGSSSIVHRHPLQILEAILDATDIPASLLDSASFDPDLYDTGARAMSHWNTARGVHGNFDRSINEPVSAFQLMDQILNLMDGALVPLTSGKLSFRQFDPSVTAVKTFDDDEIIEFKQTKTFANLINHARMLFGWKGRHASAEEEPWLRIASGGYVRNLSEQDYLFRTSKRDETSITDHAFPGESQRLQMRSFESKWVGVSSTVIADIDGVTDPVTVSCFGGHLSSFSGVERKIAGVSDGKTKFTLSAPNRVAYLMIFRASSAFQSFEIVRATAATEFPGEIIVIGDTDADGLPDSDQDGGVMRIDFTCDRGQLGTTAVPHTANIGSGEGSGARPLTAVDITIAVEYVENIIQRFSNGLPVVELDVLLTEENLGLELMDIVALDNDVYLTRGNDGADGTQKFEIISKRLHVLDDEPRISFTLALAQDPSLTATELVSRIFTKKFNDGLDLSNDAQMSDSFVTGGAQVRSGAGLTATIDSGGFLGSGGSLGGHNFAGRSVAGEGAIALTASKDHYFVWDSHRQVMIKIERDLASSDPTLGPWHTLVAKLTTDGASVTVNEDRRRGGVMLLGPKTMGGASRLTPNGALELFSRERGTFLPNGLEVVIGTIGTDVLISNVTTLSGRRSIQLDWTDGGVEPSVQSEDVFPVQQLRLYRAAAYFRTDSVDALPTINLDWYTEDGVFVSTDTEPLPKTPSTTLLNMMELRAVPPVTARYAKVRFVANGINGSSGSTFLDRWEIEETIPNFLAYLSTNQIVASTGEVPVVFTSVFFDPANAFDVATGRFKPKEDGPYELGTTLEPSGLTSGRWKVNLQVDEGSGFANRARMWSVPLTDLNDPTLGNSVLVETVRGDEWQIVSDSDTDAAYNLLSGTSPLVSYFWGVKKR